jgi:WD40 repeat protein
MIACWDIESGKLLGTLSGHTRAVEDMVITPDGKIMYSCSSDMTIRKWDLDLLQPVDILRGHLTTVFKLVLLFDDDSLWSVSADKTAIRWYLPVLIYLKQTSEIDTKLEHPDFVKSITVLNSGFVITGCRDEKIRVWDPSVILNLNQTDRCVAEINAHFGEVSSLQSCGVTFWSGSLDCTIRSWNILSVLNDFKIEKKEEQQIESLMTEEEEKELAELMDE